MILNLIIHFFYIPSLMLILSNMCMSIVCECWKGLDLFIMCLLLYVIVLLITHMTGIFV